jgi:hypothetical protein
MEGLDWEDWMIIGPLSEDMADDNLTAHTFATILV